MRDQNNKKTFVNDYLWHLSRPFCRPSSFTIITAVSAPSSLFTRLSNPRPRHHGHDAFLEIQIQKTSKSTTGTLVSTNQGILSRALLYLALCTQFSDYSGTSRQALRFSERTAHQQSWRPLHICGTCPNALTITASSKSGYWLAK